MVDFEREFEATIRDIEPGHVDRERFVPGEGPAAARAMIVGEAPGSNEVEEGRPFVGRGGAILDDALDATGLNRDDVYVTNVVKVRPPDNRDPYEDEIEAWRPLLDAEIDLVDPELVIALGRIAMRVLIGTTVTITDARGRGFEVGATTVWPTFHPAATLYDRDRLAPFRQDIRTAIGELQSPA